MLFSFKDEYVTSDSDSDDDENVQITSAKGPAKSATKISSRDKGKGRAKTPGRISTSKKAPARRLDASPSTSSGSDSGASASSDEDEEYDDVNNNNEKRDQADSLSESDSEEDEFPVGPSVSRRHLSSYSHYEDPLDAYYAKEQQKARQRAQASHNKDLAVLRTIRLNAFAQAEEAARRAADDELDYVTSILQGISIRRQQDEERIDREFKERNTQRWSEINEAIAQIEKLQMVAQEAKRKQIQAENEAKRLREEEEKRIQAEKAEQERGKKEEENNKREMARKAAEEREKVAKEQASSQAVGIPAGGATLPKPAAAPTSSANVLQDSKAEFEKWHAKIKEIKTTVLPAVSGNPAWRNACRSLKRTLSTRISNISASAADIRSKAGEIHQLLTDSKANRETYLWSLNLLSKRIIGMASSNSEADQSGVTYALAQVVIALLLADHADFAEILMARLVKRCPYVLPHHPMRGQLSIDDFNKLIGRKASEPTISYNQRMSGIVSFYAAIIQTSPSSVPHLLPSSSLTIQHVPPYFRPEAGWKWYATILRPPLPLLDLTPLLLNTFLRMNGERFHALYGKQFVKLIQAIAEQGIDAGKVQWNKETMGDLSKTRNMIGEWLQKGKVEGAEGRVPQ